MRNYGIGVVNAFILAMLVYAGLIFFIFYNHNSSKTTSYTDIKDSFINVELGEYQAQEPEKPKPVQQKKDEGQETTNKEVKTEEVAKKDTSVIDKDLFGDIKEFQDKKTIAVQSSAKSTPNASKPKEQENNKIKGDNLMPKSKKIGESNKKQQKGIYDKFMGALSRKFNENWHLFERSGNFKVELKFQIESNGIFRYTSVTKSGNAEFDNKVLSFLSTLEGKYIAAPWNKKKFNGTASLSDEIIMMGE